MNAKHLSKKQQYPAPVIEPSHGNTVKRSEVGGGKGEIVIPQYPGLAPGQTIYWSVVGNGTVFSGIEITDVQLEYRATIKFGVVFDNVDSVDARYFVVDTNGDPLGQSHDSRYAVVD